jgi:hypothetical protein
MRQLLYAVALGLMLLTGGATGSYADALTESDAAYLRSIECDPTLKYVHWTAGTEAGIHAAINDPKTANDPEARKKAVQDYLDDLFATWLWCSADPSRKDSSTCKDGVPAH